MPRRRHNQQSQLYYHGGDWHRVAMAVAEIVAFEKGYQSHDARQFWRLLRGSGSIPDLIISMNTRRRFGNRVYPEWVKYAVEITDTNPPENPTYTNPIFKTGIKDILEIRRSDLKEPDSIDALFALCRRMIP